MLKVTIVLLNYFCRKPSFHIIVKIKSTVDGEDLPLTNEEYNNSELRLFYDTYFHELKVSGYLDKELLQDIENLCKRKKKII
jgi:hypothetical protein